MRKISVIGKLIITFSAVIKLSGVLLAGLVIFSSIKGYRALDLPAFYNNLFWISVRTFSGLNRRQSQKDDAHLGIKI